MCCNIDTRMRRIIWNRLLVCLFDFLAHAIGTCWPYWTAGTRSRLTNVCRRDKFRLLFIFLLNILGINKSIRQSVNDCRGRSRCRKHDPLSMRKVKVWKRAKAALKHSCFHENYNLEHAFIWIHRNSCIIFFSLSTLSLVKFLALVLSHPITNFHAATSTPSPLLIL